MTALMESPASTGRPPAFGSATLRQAYGCFPSGVLALCGQRDDGTPVGMAVSAFVAVSLEPALVQVCIQTSSETWPVLRKIGRLGLSILSEEQGDIAKALASKSGDRFSGAQWHGTPEGAVLVHGATLWLEATVENEWRVGDHTICVLRVWEIEAHADATPLVFQGSKFRLLTPDLSA